MGPIIAATRQHALRFEPEARKAVLGIADELQTIVSEVTDASPGQFVTPYVYRVGAKLEQLHTIVKAHLAG